MLPLNGTKTHPLTEHALHALRGLNALGPRPKGTFNPGIVNRLLREELAEVVQLPSPYSIHKGKDIPHLRITAAGLVALRAPL